MCMKKEKKVEKSVSWVFLWFFFLNYIEPGYLRNSSGQKQGKGHYLQLEIIMYLPYFYSSDLVEQCDHYATSFQ